MRKDKLHHFNVMAILAACIILHIILSPLSYTQSRIPSSISGILGDRTSSTVSDVITSFRSIDVPVDARSVTLGESFTAIRDNPTAFKFNPSSLAGLTGTSFDYSQRYYDAYTSWNYKYSSYLFVMSSTIGNFGLFYDEFYQGEIPVTTPDAPDGTGQTNSVRDYVWGVIFANQISSHFDGGVTVKTYNSSYGNNSGNGAYLIDVGAIYHAAGPLSKPDFIRHEINGGFSIQNFGTDYRSGSSSGGLSPLIKLPRYVRVGFAYDLVVLNETKEKLSPYKILITGEYRYLLNPGTIQNDERRFGGFGIEGTIYEILSMRLGGFVPATDGFYGNASRPALRYGFGINLPLYKMVPNSEVSIHLDYGVIPLNSDAMFFSSANTSLKLYSAGISFTHSLFQENKQ